MQAWGTRQWIAAAALVAGLFAPLHEAAALECEPTARAGVQRCSTGLPAPQIQRTQEKSNWCWAASLAMVFAHHGLAVTQEQVVQRQLGNSFDMAIPSSALTRLLAQAWSDVGGRGFQPLATVRDETTGHFQLGDRAVVNELLQQRPLIFAAVGHAMVLVRVEFERLARDGSVRITGGTVIDPAPGRGVRPLQRQELEPSYLAAVQLAPAHSVAAVSSGGLSALQ